MPNLCRCCCCCARLRGVGVAELLTDVSAIEDGPWREAGPADTAAAPPALLPVVAAPAAEDELPRPALDSRVSTGTKVLDIKLTISHAQTTSLNSTAMRSTVDCQ